MIERDEELGEALRRLPVPEVSEPFWEQVRTSCLAADAGRPAWGRRLVRGAPRADVLFGAGWLVFGAGQLTTWAPSLPVWIGALAAGIGLLIGAAGLLAGAVSGIRRGRLPLGLGAAALGAGRLTLVINALTSNTVVVAEIGRLVLGAGAVALGWGLLGLSIDWLRTRLTGPAALTEASSRVSRLAGGLSLACFGVALLTRGLGLAAYEAAWLAQWKGWHAPWTSRQLDQLFSRGLGPFAWAGAAAAVLGLLAFVLGILTSGDRHLRPGRPAREVSAFVLALSWLGIEVKALLHGDWLPFGAGAFDMRSSGLPILNPAALIAALAALGLGIAWYALAPRSTPRAPRLRLQTCGVLLALPTIVAACPPAAAFVAPGYLAKLQARGTIRIGVKADIPRFGYLNPVSHELEGFDVDLGRLIAKQLDVAPAFVEVTSENRIPLLKEDRVDLVIATMTINEPRSRDIDFSYPYYAAYQRLLVRKGSTITDVRALDAQGARVCSARGSDSGPTIKLLAPNARSMLVGGYGECLERLEQGRVEAVSTDDVILYALRSRDPTFSQIVGDPMTIEPYGMGIRKGRPEFVDFVNETIRDVKADGTWETLYKRWVKPVTGRAEKPPSDGQGFERLETERHP